MSRIIEDIEHYFFSKAGIDIVRASARRDLITDNITPLTQSLQRRENYIRDLIEAVVMAEPRLDRADAADITIDRLRRVCADLLAIVESEYASDPEPADLGSWKRVIQQAKDVLHIKHRKEA